MEFSFNSNYCNAILFNYKSYHDLKHFILVCMKVVRFGGFYPTFSAQLLFSFFIILFWLMNYFVLIVHSNCIGVNVNSMTSKNNKNNCNVFWEGYNNSNKMCICKYWQNSFFFFFSHLLFIHRLTRAGQTLTVLTCQQHLPDFNVIICFVFLEF